MSQRNLLRSSGLIFTACLVFVVGIFAVRDGGVHIEYSISRYMGREAWSAILFMACNSAVLYGWGKYILAERGKYSGRWSFFAAIVVAGFIGLSFCPLGLFDEVYGNYGVVSILHQIFSRAMFVAMAGMVFEMFLRAKGRKKYAFFGFLIYAAGCVVASFLAKWFWDLNIIIESAYIYGFMLMLAIAGEK